MCLKSLDSRFRGNDGKREIRTFYETIKIHLKESYPNFLALPGQFDQL
jgi:hypothetical protein